MDNNFINNNQNQNQNIFLTIEDVLKYLFIIYFFTNAPKLYSIYNKNKTYIHDKVIKLCNNGEKYAVTIKNSIGHKMVNYINLIKQYYTPKIESIRLITES